MEKPQFVYTTYIRTTPERLWQALTEPAFTRRWWQTTFDTDWAVGSPMIWDNHGIVIADPEQVVLESDPYRRLVVHVAHLHAGAERALGFGDDAVRQARRRTSVAGRLRHRAGRGDGQTDRGPRRLRTRAARRRPWCRNGWPVFLSSLKSLLETGEPLASTRIDREAD